MVRCCSGERGTHACVVGVCVWESARCSARFCDRFASYVIVNISRDLNSYVLISSERSSTHSIDSVIESIIDLAHREW